MFRRFSFAHKDASYAIAAGLTLLAWSPVLFHSGFTMHGDLAYNTTLQNLQANYFPLWDQHPSSSNFDEIDRILIIQPLLWVAEFLHLGIGPFSRIFPFLVNLCGALGIVYSLRVMRSVLLDAADEPSFVPAEILAVVIFSLNPWILYRVEAPYYQMAYNFTPLFIALQIRYLTRGTIGYAIAAVACWTLASGSPQYTIFTAFMSLLFLAMTHRGAAAPSWFKLFGRYLAVLVGYGILNMYWIGAFFDINRVSELTPGYVLRWIDVQGFSANSSFFNVISGIDVWVTWWKDFNPLAAGWYDSFANLLRPSTFAFAAICIALNARMRFFQVAAVIIAVLILLLEGASGPISPIYKFMVFHVVPGYGWIIRAPEKFGAFLWIFYAWTIGLGVDRLSRKFSRALMTGASIAAGSVSVLAFLPVMYATLFFHYIPVPIPKTYMQVWNALKERRGKVLLLADYEHLGQYNAGDAVFKWAPKNMASGVAPRSFPLPTFGVYHFTNPFSYFYSFIKFAGPQNVTGLSAIVGTRYVALEHDVVGDDAWYEQWKAALLRQRARLVLENTDFAVFEIPSVPSREIRSGPYAVLAGDLNALLPLTARFGSQLAHRNLFFLEQMPAPDVEALLDRASLLILDNRTLADVADDSLVSRYSVPLPTSTGQVQYKEDWAAERLAYRFEANGGFWGDVRSGTNSSRWVLDDAMGTLATNAKRAAFDLALPSGVTAPEDLYIRAYVGRSRAANAFHVVTPNKTTYVQAFTNAPKWQWFKVGEFEPQARVAARVVNDYGLSVIGSAILVPRGSRQMRLRELRERFEGRIVTNIARFDIGRWPSARVLSQALPSSKDVFEADESLTLDESYDPLWVCRTGNRTINAIPAWAFENGCAPIDGPTRLLFVPQESVVKWLKIEGIIVLALGVFLTAALLRKRKAEA